MKVLTKTIEDGEKCGGCNWANTVLFGLDGWDKDDWLCGRCFAEELANNNYKVFTERDNVKLVR